jgi:hypothetical protein
MPNVSVGLGGKQHKPDANSERQPIEYRACDECDNSMGYVDSALEKLLRYWTTRRRQERGALDTTGPSKSADATTTMTLSSWTAMLCPCCKHTGPRLTPSLKPPTSTPASGHALV